MLTKQKNIILFVRCYLIEAIVNYLFFYFADWLFYKLCCAYNFSFVVKLD